MEMSEPETIPCLNCHLGMLRRIRATYAHWFQGELIVVPDAGAWQCDVCGEFVYDDDAIVFAELLAGASAPTRAPEQRPASSGEAAPLPPQATDHRRV
jgi:YgiT-type zinc finger domain-containing protein